MNKCIIMLPSSGHIESLHGRPPTVKIIFTPLSSPNKNQNQYLFLPSPLLDEEKSYSAMRRSLTENKADTYKKKPHRYTNFYTHSFI